MLGAGVLCDEAGLLPQLESCRYREQLIGVLGIAVIHERSTDMKCLIHLYLRGPAAYPELFSALIYFIGYADHHRIEHGVQSGNRSFQQQLAGKGLKLIIDKSGQRLYVQDHRWL